MGNFWNKHYEEFKKLYEECFIYLIDGKEVSEKEFMEYIIKRGKRKNERNTKENNL